jgi:hypothetical protein
MKKSLIAMALMFGAVVFAMPSCGSDDNNDEVTTYNCTCNNANYTANGRGLTADQKTAYEDGCRNSTPSSPSSVKGAQPKLAPSAACN